MALAKLTISTHAQYAEAKNEGNKGIDRFEVLFNPNAYTVEDGSTWQDQERNRQKSELQYTGGQRKTLTMELFLDTYEQGTDVRTHTSKLARLLIPSIDFGNGKRPPIVRLNWGPKDPDTASGIFPFICVLEKLTQKFTLFASDGFPVRATLNVTFKEFSLPPDELKRNPPRNSFPAYTYTVKAGDTLSTIAAQYWQAPDRWRRIAGENKILNPRILHPGQVLIIPTISDESREENGRSRTNTNP